jgi:hypothetical protein
MSRLNQQIELFRKQKELIINYFKVNGVDKVSLYSATTFIPLIPIYTFIMEEIPEHTELCESKLKNLREFYGETK